MKNSKKGFTLSEVLIVVAIIVIVSAAGMAGIAIAVQDANARGEKIQQLHGEGNWEAEANQKIKENVPVAGDDEVLEESLDTPAPTAGATSDSETLDEGTPTPTAGSGSAGTGTDSGSTGTGTGGGTTDADTGSTGTGTGTGSGSSSSTDVITDAPGGNSGSTGGGVTATNGLVTSGKGVSALTSSSSGVTTVTVQNDNWNKATFTITDTGDGYELNFTGDNKYILDQNVFKDMWKGESYTLNSDQINYLKNTYGLSIG
jgi:prepilin-type N-terminal cleavage/methylation domain-containing protein